MKLNKLTALLGAAIFLFEGNLGTVLADSNYKVNSKILLSNSPKQYGYILDYKKVDVTGDKVKDDVFLVVGNKPASNSVSFSIPTVYVKDGKTKKMMQVYAGIETSDTSNFYSPKLFVGDFNGDKKNEIFYEYSTKNGGVKAGLSRYVNHDGVYENEFVPIYFMDRANPSVVYWVGKLLNNYKVQITSLCTQKKYTIDITDKKVKYDKLGYYKRGKFQAQKYNEDGVQCAAYIYSSIIPKDINNDGVYEIVGDSYVTLSDPMNTILDVIAKSTCEWSCSKSNKITVKSLTVKKYKSSSSGLK